MREVLIVAEAKRVIVSALSTMPVSGSSIGEVQGEAVDVPSEPNP